MKDLMRLRVVALFTMAAVSGLFVLEAQEITIELPSARSAAIGGVHVAYSDDLSSLFHNPAGFVTADPQLSVAEITAGVRGPVFDITNIVLQAVSGAEITTLLGTDAVLNLVQSIHAGADVAGPIYFGYVGKGLGFGFFNTTDVTLSTIGPLSLGARVGEQIMLSGGYALRLPIESELHAVDVGVLLKGALRGEVQLDRSLLELPSLFSDLSFETISSEPFNFIAGLGVDLGLRYAYQDIFALGIVGRNLYTPTFTRSYSSLDAFLEGLQTPTQNFGTLPIDLSIGALISPRLGRLERYINSIDIFIDYDDVLDFILNSANARNPILHISLGLQVTVLHVLDLRAGFADGLFCAGLGIDLTYFRLNVSMFGSELSAEPGLQPVFNTMIGLEFRL